MFYLHELISDKLSSNPCYLSIIIHKHANKNRTLELNEFFKKYENHSDASESYFKV